MAQTAQQAQANSADHASQHLPALREELATTRRSYEEQVQASGGE